MASSSVRQLPVQTVIANLVQPREEVTDAGAYNKAQIQFRVLKAGSAGTVTLQHAAVNEPDAFKDVSGAQWNLNATTNSFTTVADFLRYLRVVSDANVAGSPVAMMDIILKE